VVDLDLEKFFDRVNHDKLMAAIARRVTDKRVLRLIGAFLKVGVLENGLVSPAEEGNTARWTALSTSIEHRTR
jgi:Retron-type reverse transcriptase